MALKKTLALLEISHGLVNFFSALAEEETAQEQKQLENHVRPADIPQELPADEPSNSEPTPEQLPAPTVEEVPQIFATTEDVADYTASLGDVVAKEEPAAPIQVPPATAKKLPAVSERRLQCEQRTQEVISRGDFRAMIGLRREMNAKEYKDLAKQVTEEIDRRNRQQAQRVLDERNETFRILLEAIRDQDAQWARRILSNLQDTESRLDNLNEFVEKQLEQIEGKSAEEIRSAFQEQLLAAEEHIEKVENELKEKRRQEIDAAINGGIDEKLAKKVRDLIGRLDANIKNKNFGAAKSCYNELYSPELELALIAHFKNEERAKQYLRESDTAIALLSRRNGKHTSPKRRFALAR